MNGYHEGTAPMDCAFPFLGRGGKAGVVLRFAIYAVRVDVRRAFRDRRLGTWGGTLGLAALVVLAGTLFGTILKRDIESFDVYIPWLATGLIAWMFFIGTISDTCGRAGSWARVLRHTAVPLEAVPLAVLFGQGVILGQNIVVLGLCYAIFLNEIPINLGAALFGLVVLAINGYLFALIGFILCLRFRNLSHMISWATQAGFLLTPLLWPEYFLGRYQYLNDLNPFHHMVMLLRAPLLGREISPVAWTTGVALLLLGSGCARLLHKWAARNLSYWL